jgi:DNA-directed RNA polymerase specialized sigma24 family protein
MYRIALNTALTQYRRGKSKVPLSFIGFEFKDVIDKNDSSDQQENIDLLYSAIRYLKSENESNKRKITSDY